MIKVETGLRLEVTLLEQKNSMPDEQPGLDKDL